MPSAMIHLSIARSFGKNPGSLFYIGNLAPDCIDIREIKDHTHFRDRDDREQALLELKEKTDTDSPFELGILLHLFADRRWDIFSQSKYRIFFGGNARLFRRYRHEIGIASAYMYQSYDWAPDVWDKMCDTPKEKYSLSPDFPAEDIYAYLIRNRKWHIEISAHKSPLFPPEFIDEFVIETVDEFKNWIKL